MRVLVLALALVATPVVIYHLPGWLQALRRKR